MAPNERLWIRTLEEAQQHVPFPLHVPPGRLIGVAVRPAGPDLWPTVRSIHASGLAVYTIKQYAMDWWGHFCAPNKLYMTRPRRWAPYGPTVDLELDPRSAFHGRDRSGHEAGSLVSLGAHIELKVTAGRLGRERVRTILDHTRPVSRRSARDLASRPLTAWNWTVQPVHVPHSRESDWHHKVRWVPSRNARAVRRIGHGYPEIPGWRLDSVGTFTRPDGTIRRRVLLYRSHDLNTTLEVEWSSGASEARHRSDEVPQEPLFRLIRSGDSSVRMFRCRTMRWAKAIIQSKGGSVRITVPPGRSEAIGDGRIVASFQQHFV